MSKLPAIQFYPNDWRSDVGVQSLSYHDRGVWLEILCLMHGSAQRGKLLLNGKPMPTEVLARLLGLDKQKLEQTISNLLSFGVASIDDETGALMNRRMVKDEEIRQIRKKAGKKGGNPFLLNQNSTKAPTKTQPNGDFNDKQNPTPSSSSSSSLTFTDARAFPLKELYESFPDLELTPAQCGMIESEVKAQDREAWLATLKTYKANYNPAKNQYLPEKVGNLLSVFKQHRRDLEKQGGLPVTPFVPSSDSPPPKFCDLCRKSSGMVEVAPGKWGRCSHKAEVTVV